MSNVAVFKNILALDLYHQFYQSPQRIQIEYKVGYVINPCIFVSDMLNTKTINSSFLENNLNIFLLLIIQSLTIMWS